MAKGQQTARENSAEPVRRRLSPEARRSEIIRAAVELFSETGFDGSTRDVARRAGIKQPLLYRYFPDKKSLIEAVYRRVFLETWNPDWDPMLQDRSRPVVERFQSFYEAYTDIVFQPVWLRLWYYVLLRDAEVHAWYREVVQEQILKPLVRERRAELGHGDIFSVTVEELDVPWLLHGGLLNYGLRQSSSQSSSDDRAAIIRKALDLYMQQSAMTPPD
ncbi:TetR/AcrR family transcriptional regulator [Rhodobacteraceae bacterium LMO-12]|nr:TetR/AcrR family transcriptional regulator [Rhodobacteraceae bacterium LMO-JJ12]